MAVILDLTDIVAESGQRWAIPLDFAPAPIPDAQFDGPAAGEVVVYNTGSELVFGGQATAVLRAACSRCLTPFELPLTGEIEAEVPLSLVEALLVGKPVEMEPDLAAVLSADGANLGELIGQALVLALPMQTVCSEECRGLCAGCGKNLNTETCQCAGGETDPRLRALARWARA
jgi:uncharacterized protein